MPIKYGLVEAYNDDQLVVALPELEVVKRKLEHLGVHWDKIEPNAVLGLALISKLTDLRQAVHDLLESEIGPELERFRAERAQVIADPSDLADLDLLVKGIQLKFGREFPGWEVTIGKNYGPSFVRGYPHLRGGGHGVPEPADTALPPPGTDPCATPELGRGVRVGLLDTRLFPDEWLTGRYIARRSDLLDPGADTFTVFDGHCTFVGSCILQRAPAAEIHVHHVLSSEDEGSAWDAAIAIAEMAEVGVDVVNLSFGEFLTDDNTAPIVLEAAVKRFGSDTVVVAAAGNNGDGREQNGAGPNWASYPAALADVVGVGALDPDGKLAAFTPHPAPWIALLAPGVRITGAYVKGDVIIEHKDRKGDSVGSKQVISFPNGTAIWEGCSFAAGTVSGAIAARTVPGRRSARQALEELLHPEPGRPGCGILPNKLDS
jgi:hypothetical protein